MTMASYNEWANVRLYAMARGLADELYRRNVGAFFGSLHGTLNHLLVTDRIWMHRFTGTGDNPRKLDEILYEELQSLEFARRQEDRRLIEYVTGLSDEEIQGDLEYSTTGGVLQRNALGDLLVHLFNHQTHHRGQAHVMLTVLGVVNPRPLDLLVMLREKPSA